MKKIVLFLGFVLIVFSSSTLKAAAPTCQVSSANEPYCSYKGKIEVLYVNDSNNILLYFDTDLNLDNATNVGITGVTAKDRVVVRYDQNVKFADYFYSTALSAFAAKKTVLIQMRTVYGGALVADRIWITNE